MACGVLGGFLRQEEEVAGCEVDEGVEDGGAGAVEAGGAEDMEDWGGGGGRFGGGWMSLLFRCNWSFFYALGWVRLEVMGDWRGKLSSNVLPS